MPERRSLNRCDYTYYMCVMNERTGELIGHVSDISTGGFKLESPVSILPNLDFIMRIDVPEDITDLGHIVFVARSRWCHKHSVDHRLFNVGFQIMEINPGEMEIFSRIFEKYGSSTSKRKDDLDYLWR